MVSIRFSIAFFLLWLIVSCDTVDAPDPSDVSVSISAGGLSDDKLPLNGTATFTAEVSGYKGDPSELSFRWALTTGRGTLSDGTNSLPNPTVGTQSIRCVGTSSGDEKITVRVQDGNNELVATGTFDFVILPPSDPVIGRGCFDQPKIIFQYGSTFYSVNFDGSGRKSIGVSGGLSAAVSPDGEWIAWNDDSSTGWDMHVQRCDGSDKIKIPGGTSEDFFPVFSPDSKTLYFLRPEPSQEKPLNAVRPLDIAAYDLETRQFRFLTTIYSLDERVGNFTVSPVTGEIAFFRQSYENLQGGGYRVTTRLSFLQPEGGLIRDFTTLPSSQYDFGLDWSPDGKDIIFSSEIDGVRGIYRINITDGSKPVLVFGDPSPESLPPYYPHYYAGGARIVWGGQENGQNNINLWSIDANGADMQQVTNLSGTEFLQGVLH